MKFIVIPLVLLTAVVLVVSLIYIISINRSKENLALIEKGLDPNEHRKDRFFLNAVKAGIMMIGIGIGFLIALLLDEYVLIGIDNPAIYPATIFSISGISLVIFYAIFNTKESN